MDFHVKKVGLEHCFHFPVQLYVVFVQKWLSIVTSSLVRFLYGAIEAWDTPLPQKLKTQNPMLNH